MKSRLRRWLSAAIVAVGAVLLMLGVFFLGEVYSVSQWAPVRAKDELGYITRLASMDQRSPGVAALVEIHNMELDLQLQAYRGTLFARPVSRAYDYVTGDGNRETLDAFIREAASYRRDHPFTPSYYTSMFTKNVRDAVDGILGN